ncbi:MAG: hypothetical protein ACRC41_09415 [Sarcina sp.]
MLINFIIMDRLSKPNKKVVQKIRRLVNIFDSSFREKIKFMSLILRNVRIIESIAIIKIARNIFNGFI